MPLMICTDLDWSGAKLMMRLIATIGSNTEPSLLVSALDCANFSLLLPNI